jgi:competence protein ComEC
MSVLAIYIVLVDFKPPVMRASIMALLYLGAQIIQRKTNPAQILAAAAFLILLLEPRELFNPGFQFSFTAVIAIIFGYRKLSQLIPANYKILQSGMVRNILVNPLLVSVSAVIGTVPLTLHYYGVVPVIAVIANLLVIPLIGVNVLLGFFLLIFHPISFALCEGLGILINLIQYVLLWITEIFARIPFASLDYPIPDTAFIILLSSALALITFFNMVHLRQLLPVFVILVAVYLLIRLIPNAPALHVTFIDVGQGDAAYLEFPNGATMLIDAGNANNYWDCGKKTVTPFLKYIGARKINYLVGSHPHDDHIGGFRSIINKFSVDTVVVSAYRYQSHNYSRFLHMCHTRAIPLRTVQKGEQLYPDSTCRVYILHPDSEHVHFSSGSGAECNNSSLVIKVQYGKNGILFTGDLEMEAEPALFPYSNFMECELLKIAHHGSKTSTSQSLLDFTQPLVAIISVAQKNKFKHPSPGTVNRLAANGIQTYFTSRDGALRFELARDKIKKIAWK